jgi:hypothetical protein
MGDAAHGSSALAVDLGGTRRLDRRTVRRGRPVEVDENDPTSLDRAAAVVWRRHAGEVECAPHLAGEVDSFLLRAGVRNALLRYVPRSVRLTWWRELKVVPLPDGTRVCWDGAEVWLDEVERRLVRHTWQERRMRRWRRFAALVAASVQRGGRPITGPGLTLPELAVALGDPDKPISERYVTKIIRWFRDEQLLRVVMPGTRSARLHVPEDELKPGTVERTAYEVAVEAAHDARHRVLKKWHEDELAARAAGVAPPPHPDELAAFREHLGPMPARDDDVYLLRVAQVYELLIPEAPDVRDAPPQRSLPRGVVDLAAARERRAQARHGALSTTGVRPGIEAVLSTLDQPRGSRRQLTRALRGLSVDTEASESSTPSLFTTEGGSVLQNGGVVDERRPSGGSYAEVLAMPEGPNHPMHTGPAPLRAAWRLLRGILTRRDQGEAVLPRQLCVGVTPVKLARWIGPFVAAGWTDAQLVAVIAHRGGAWSYVPPEIPNPLGWIRAALNRWTPAAPPLPDEIRGLVDDVEAENERARREREQRGPEIHKAAHWAAIAGCELCDDLGFRQLDGSGPPVRCYHSPADAAEAVVEDPAPLPLDQVDELIARTLGKRRGLVDDEVLAEARRRYEARRAAEAEAVVEDQAPEVEVEDQGGRLTHEQAMALIRNGFKNRKGRR